MRHHAAIDQGNPFFGAVPGGGGTTFRVWAPAARRAHVVLESGGNSVAHEMTAEAAGLFVARVSGVAGGQLYRFSLDGGMPMPDPASRFQPFGVHGPSEVIDPGTYEWHDGAWTGVEPECAVIYELHVGTFTRAGTFESVAAMVPYLRGLGVTVIELMPVADFPGERNWGYDGVCLFAPSRVYGRPDDLRRLVDVAHQAGLAVMLDVVYNHLGPDGAYLHAFAPQYFSSTDEGPWGQAVNLDGPHSAMVRRFILDNVRHWLTEYHLDGLRLDATHALVDRSERHIVAELAHRARRAATRPIMIVAEDHRNDARMLRPGSEGWGLDGVWADDFHHILRRILAGDSEGYYEDYEASIADLATTIRQGWFFTGQYSKYLNGPRGTDPAGIPPHKFVVCLQNHDQIGNRALGERVNRQVPLQAYRAASALLLLAPGTPLIFMGQEWAATSPFAYFTDHVPALGEQVVIGRRREFARFSEFRDPEARERIPSPQDRATFERSRLNWDERERAPHRGVHRLYQECLRLRERLFAEPEARSHPRVETVGDDTIVVGYTSARSRTLIVCRLRGMGLVPIDGLPAAPPLFTTEDERFAGDGLAPEVRGGSLHFGGPATVVFSVRT